MRRLDGAAEKDSPMTPNERPTMPSLLAGTKLPTHGAALRLIAEATRLENLAQNLRAEADLGLAYSQQLELDELDWEPVSTAEILEAFAVAGVSV